MIRNIGVGSHLELFSYKWIPAQELIKFRISALITRCCSWKLWNAFPGSLPARIQCLSRIFSTLAFGQGPKFELPAGFTNAWSFSRPYRQRKFLVCSLVVPMFALMFGEHVMFCWVLGRSLWSLADVLEHVMFALILWIAWCVHRGLLDMMFGGCPGVLMFG